MLRPRTAGVVSLNLCDFSVALARVGGQGTHTRQLLPYEVGANIMQSTTHSYCVSTGWLFFLPDVINIYLAVPYNPHRVCMQSFNQATGESNAYFKRTERGGYVEVPLKCAWEPL